MRTSEDKCIEKIDVMKGKIVDIEKLNEKLEAELNDKKNSVDRIKEARSKMESTMVLIGK